MQTSSPDTLTWLWWGVMVAIAIFNVGLYGYVVLHQGGQGESASIRLYMRRMKWLAIPFVVECAWRSIFPSVYNTRQVFWDTPLNAILVDRALAALGEVVWVTQIAMALAVVSKDVERQPNAVRGAGACMVLLAVTGECFSFAGTFTTNALFEIFEASCWTGLFAVGAVCGAYLYCHVRKLPRATANTAQNFTLVMGIQGLIYCPYMLISNIPMYEKRYRSDQANHTHYLPWKQGLHDAMTRRVETHAWSKWQSEWLWMTIYFSLAVWSSILMLWAPRVKKVGAHGSVSTQPAKDSRHHMLLNYTSEESEEAPVQQFSSTYV